MSRRAFRLASLLRLRKAQEDQAAAVLARAAADRLRASQRADSTREQLAGHRFPTGGSTAWTAAVAARAALSATAVEAAAQAEEATALADHATDQWRERRRDTQALTRLEERHDARERTREQREEQLRIDEHTAALRAGRTPEETP